MPSPSTYSTLTLSHSFMTTSPSPLCPHSIASYVLSTFSLAPSQTHLKPSAGVANSFPNFLWDHLLSQTELTLNLLFQSTLATDMSAWEHFNGPFNFDATPIGPIGCPVIIHNKTGTHLF